MATKFDNIVLPSAHSMASSVLHCTVGGVYQRSTHVCITLCLLVLSVICMDPESFVGGGLALTFFFLLEGPLYHLNQAMIGQPVKRHLNRVSPAGRCWPNIGSFVTFQGIQTSVVMEPLYSFPIFQRGGGVRTPCPPSGSAHV